MAASDRYSAAGKAGLAGKIAGLREAKRAFQALPDVTRTAMLEATSETVQAIAAGARARIQRSPSVQTRTLLNAVAWRVTKTNGRGKVGISPLQTKFTSVTTRRRESFKGRIVVRGGRQQLARADRYAKFVEFGTRKMPAEPFMIPAVEDQKQPYLDRCRAAGATIAREVARVGLGAATS